MSRSFEDSTPPRRRRPPSRARVCLTRFRRKMPASTGVQGRKGMSQRGVIPSHCARVFVAFASCLAALSATVPRPLAIRLDPLIAIAKTKSARCRRMMRQPQSCARGAFLRPWARLVAAPLGVRRIKILPDAVQAVLAGIEIFANNSSQLSSPDTPNKTMQPHGTPVTENYFTIK